MVDRSENDSLCLLDAGFFPTVFGRPFGTYGCAAGPAPNVETLGYCRGSLRDRNLIRADQCYSSNFKLRVSHSKPVATVQRVDWGRRARIHLRPLLSASSEASRSAMTMSSPAFPVSARMRP